MAAKIYSVPKEIGPPPEPNYETYDHTKEQEREQAWVKKVQAWCLKQGSGELAGELWYYPVGDGSAQYVVYTQRPLALIHLPVGDAWSIPDVVRRGLTVTDIRQRVARNHNPLFGRS